MLFKVNAMQVGTNKKTLIVQGGLNRNGQDQYKYLKSNSRHTVPYSDVSLTKQEQSQFRRKSGGLHIFIEKKQIKPYA